MGGESLSIDCTVSWTWGSPPHVWGKHITVDYVDRCHRITPTYVGTTELPSLARALPRDHPHIRGDHNMEIKEEEQAVGSPPHTWGPPVHQR